MNPPLGARCVSCQRPFTSDGWINRHSISDTEADDHQFEPGDHHDTCCQLCNLDDEVAR